MKHRLLAAAIMLPAAAIAATPTLTVVNGVRAVEGHGAPAKQTQPYWSPAAGRVTVFNNLGKPVDYEASYGTVVSNLDSPAGVEQWMAQSIKPKASVTLTEIVEAIENDTIVPRSTVTIALLADNNGLPGEVITEKTVTVRGFANQCCAVSVYRVTDGTKLVAGTTYWVGALLPKKSQSKTFNAWMYSIPSANADVAIYNPADGGWFISPQAASAFAVYGK